MNTGGWLGQHFGNWPQVQPPLLFGPLVGLVDQLKGTLTQENERRGEVILSLYDHVTDEVFKTQADLNVDQYKLADGLHMSGRMVFVSGRLKRGRRVSRLAEITAFEDFDQLTA